MSATLNLDKFELLWFIEGFVGKSHLRWDGYKIMINNVYPQLSDTEREFIYVFAKRDFSWMFEKEKDTTSAKYFRQMLARYNPANQYIVSCDNGKEHETVLAYKWDDRYYITATRCCAPEFVKKTEQISFKKCTNKYCELRESCMRYSTYKEGDKIIDGGKILWCKECDLKITEIETI